MRGIEISKIRVAMYFPFPLPAYGGAELATYNLAKALQQFCQVRICAFNKSSGVLKETKTGTAHLPGVPVMDDVPIYKYSAINLPFVKNFPVTLLKDLNQSDEEILHFQGVPRFFGRFMLQKCVRRKIKILTTHGLQEVAGIQRANRLGSLASPFLWNSLKSLDHIIALSITDLNFLVSLGIDKSKVTFIPNGIDAEKFMKRRRFVNRNGRFKILCVARFDRNKNYELLISALEKLKNAVEFEAYFVGAITDPEYFKQIKRLIERKKLAEFIHIEPSLDDPALVDCYLSCDLFVLPSKAETFSLVLLEAMYAGLPVVATPVGYVPYVIKNQINGFIVSKNDSTRLFETCLTLLKDENMRRRMGSVNKEIAQEYTWDKIALATNDLYCHLLEKTTYSG